MKKVMKLAVMALAVISLTVACKQKAAEEVDTTPIDTMPIEAVLDTMPVEEVLDTVVAEPVKKTVKKAIKKAAKVDPNAKESTTSTSKTVTITKVNGPSKTIAAPGTPSAADANKVGSTNGQKVDPTARR